MSWSKPDGGNNIDRYYAEWYEHGKNQRVGYKDVEHILGNLNYNFTISNLLPGAKYKVWVVAENSGGYGFYQSADITTGKSHV